MAGMSYAIEQGYRQVITMDADFSHDPQYLPDFLAGMNPPGGRPVDVMIGSRYIPGGGVEGWPFKRHFMSRAVNLYARWLLGLQPKDCSGGYRCYRTELLKKIGSRRGPQPRLFVPGGGALAAKRAGARFGETPIVFVNRREGASKINAAEAVAAVFLIFGMAVRNLFGLK